MWRVPKPYKWVGGLWEHPGGAQQHPWVRAGCGQPQPATCRPWRENGAWRRDVSHAEVSHAEVAARKCPRLPW